jgi:hypothetical protein
MTLRTYGRVVVNPLYPDVTRWVKVTTDEDGYDDMVWLTTLIQVIRLNLGESPFFANYGIPAHPSVVTQLAPDYYMNFTQQQFSNHFLSLIISRQEDAPDESGIPSPYYLVNVITNYGAVLREKVPY